MSNHYLNLVDTEIRIGGKRIEDTVVLELFQTMSGHHRFTITINYNALKDSVWVETPEAIYQKLLEPLAIIFTHRTTGEKTEFKGVITKIDIGGELADKGYVTLYGGSPTLLLDMDESMEGFVDETLSTIVNRIVGNLNTGIEVSNNPQNANRIPYVARYSETSWNFLSRIASSCGDWLYYDGVKLIVGNPNIQKETVIIYDIELKKVRFSSQLMNLNRWIYDYQYSMDRYLPEMAEKIERGFNSYSRIARDKSAKIFPHNTIQKSPREVVNINDVGLQMKAINSRNIQQMSVLHAESETCAIRLGEMITTRLPENIKTKGGYDLGRYRVIEIKHVLDKNGRYHNEIKGVPGLTEALPVDPEIFIPVAYPEPALVVDNADPKNLGRVRVRTYWMEENDATNWIRVQSPDAGMSDHVKNNRGFFFVPENGDQVILSYENGDGGRPYVSGSLFNSSNTSGVANENTVKSIQTRSGLLIELNDDEKGDWGIKIIDRKKNVIRIDTKDDSIEILANQNVTITADDTMTLNAKTLNINVSEDMTTIVGKDQKTSVSGTVENTENELKETITQNVTRTIGQKFSETTGESKHISDGDYIVKSAGKALIQGAQDARISKG